MNTSKLSRPALLANLAMLATVLFWGCSYISIKVVVGEVPPITMAALRFALAAAVMFALLRRLEPQARLAPADRWRMALAGASGITLYFCFENAGVKLTTASNASLIAAVVPILAIGLDMAVYRSRPGLWQGLGIAAALAGAWLAVTANGQIDLASGRLAGNLLMVAAMAAWAVYTVLSKSLQDRYSGLAMISYQTIAGAALLLPASLLDLGQWRGLSLVAAANLLYLVVICSVVCYLLYAYALKRLDVAVTTIYLNLVPVVGVAAGALVLGERMLEVQLLGGGVIVAGIFLANLRHFAKRGGGRPGA